MRILRASREVISSFFSTMKRKSSDLPLPLSPSSRPSKKKMFADSKSRGKSPQQESSGLGDVPCYTCRRRHVKCDRTLPHCAKCAKKGVQCLGYRKPLRWAEGVAIRGKLKGKSQPILDSQAVSIARENFAQTQSSIQAKAKHIGLHTAQDSTSDLASNIKHFQELIDYYNTTICAKQATIDLYPRVAHEIAPLSPEILQKLHPDVLNCLLGISAVHMSARNPGNRSIERIALETKVRLFQGINKLFQNPQDTRPDILLSCIYLLFSMDVMENGFSRWHIHCAGALKLLESTGELTDFASDYPHLKSSLALTFYCRTMSFLFSPTVVADKENATRKGIDSICFDPDVRQAFIPCPRRLLLDIYDMKECALNISRAHGSLSIADVYTREWILADVLHFEPGDGTRDIKENYFRDRSLTTQEEDAWNLVFSAWRSVAILVVLRLLYFGVQDPEPPSHTSRSSSPSYDDIVNYQMPKIENPVDFDAFSNQPNMGLPTLPEGQDPFPESSRLSPGLYRTDTISRSPSPLYASLPTTKSVSLDLWSHRYEIHNEAFVELSSNLLTLSGSSNSSYLRFVLTPLSILGFLSRPNSHERELFLTIVDQFKRQMSELASSGPPNPIGGGPLEFNIPWERLDAFSAETERNEPGRSSENKLYGSACEWNWGCMLRSVQSELLWPLAAGRAHMELGTDFWAFAWLHNLVNPNCLAELSQGSSTSMPSSSSN